MTTIKYYWEDFVPGWEYESPARTLTAPQIIAFAREYDPQPFHLDEEAAKGTFFGGLAASGWHTAAISMKLLVGDGAPFAGGIIGSGIFLNPSIVAQRVGTSASTLAVWIGGGVVALIGAFIFGELGQRRPRPASRAAPRTPPRSLAGNSPRARPRRPRGSC